jgi:hypothetical protein
MKNRDSGAVEEPFDKLRGGGFEGSRIRVIKWALGLFSVPIFHTCFSRLSFKIKRSPCHNPRKD